MSRNKQIRLSDAAIEELKDVQKREWLATPSDAVMWLVNRADAPPRSSLSKEDLKSALDHQTRKILSRLG